MADPIISKEPVPVIADTQHRLTWKAVATWLQAAGATTITLIEVLYHLQDTIKPMIPERFAALGGVLFTIGKIIDAWQRQQDVKRPKNLVNFSNDT